MENKIDLAILGGSGMYSMPGLQDSVEVMPQTPYGSPSAPIVIGTLQGKRLAFLARHGIGHVLSPSAVPFRANIYALKQLGVERIVSISACGSLREDYTPGDIVVPDQLMDYTRRRPQTFFEDGLVAHVSVADPFCPDLSAQVYQAVSSAGGTVHNTGALVTIEGPRFSTRAESNTFRALGMSIINMTTAPEAFLAREAEICYCVMNHVTDYDVWHISEEPVSVDQVVEILKRIVDISHRTVSGLAKNLTSKRDCECGDALATAFITEKGRIPRDALDRLQPLVGRYFSDPE